MALTHPAYQKEAEEALYRTLAINTYNSKDLKCLETLAQNEGKAKLVRRLIVECGRRRVYDLLKALPEMRALVDLRIRLRPDEAWKWVILLDQGLW